MWALTMLLGDVSILTSYAPGVCCNNILRDSDINHSLFSLQRQTSAWSCFLTPQHTSSVSVNNIFTLGTFGCNKAGKLCTLHIKIKQPLIRPNLSASWKFLLLITHQSACSSQRKCDTWLNIVPRDVTLYMVIGRSCCKRNPGYRWNESMTASSFTASQYNTKEWVSLISTVIDVFHRFELGNSDLVHGGEICYLSIFRYHLCLHCGAVSNHRS